MTNYEAIKTMDQHELAGFLVGITTCGDCPAFDDCDGHGVCTEAMLEWLTDESREIHEISPGTVCKMNLKHETKRRSENSER